MEICKNLDEKGLTKREVWVSFQIVGIGELLWDLLPGGRQLGGAPANFSCHAAALGARAFLISRVGDDEPGRDLIEGLERLGVRTECIEIDPVAPTGSVSVTLDDEGHPHYTIHEGVAWDFIGSEEDGRRAMAGADAVCFGTLAQRCKSSGDTLRSLLEVAPRDSLRVFDINLRQQFHTTEIIEHSLSLANVLKMNETELPRLAKTFLLSGTDREQIAELVRLFRLRSVAFTRGSRGSLLYADGRWSDHRGFPTSIVDTVGAGDAFTAALTLGLLAGWDLDVVHHRASEVASYVCSQAGATPILPESLRAPYLALASKRPDGKGSTSTIEIR